MQAIHLYGPSDRSSILVLLAVATFGEADGALRGWDFAGLASVAGLTERALRRALTILANNGLLFTFGSSAGEHTVFATNCKRLARRALCGGAGGALAVWAEAILGIARFPQASSYREALRK